MKTVVGIDLGGYWVKAAALLKRMQIKGMEPVCVNVVESLLPDGSFVNLPENHPLTQIISENTAEGQRLAEEACDMLGGGTAQTIQGSPKEALLKVCDEVQGSLVAIGSEKRGSMELLFFGSVAKGLLTGAKCSVLFGKQEIPHDGPLTAVFATDHSDYANRAADWLRDAHTEGIGKLVVLTAVEVNPLVGRQVVQHVQNVGESVIESIMNGIRDKNSALAQRIAEKGMECVAEVREAHPSVAIEACMKEHNADLLIVGAQGRGFLERLRVGSNSFEQVVNTPYNVLVIRP